MTKIVFFRSGGAFYGFEEQGHTGYGESGDDVLCAALSAMTMLIVNTVELSYASDVQYEINEGATEIKVSSKAALEEFEKDERKRFAVSGIFQAYYYQLNDMIEDYSDYLDVEVVDRPYGG
ncbi:MAG: ribosomal-processing cysteine protease Prp [Clostridia bacterium]|nr:ribosomal-processing cysteine protease Prp [Clostridia bacterium]